MSLINESRKKAQKQHLAEQAGTPTQPAPEAPATQKIAKRGQPMAAKSTVMLAVGGAVLLAITGAFTLWIFMQEPEPEPPRRRPVASAPKLPPANEPEPTVMLPDIVPKSAPATASANPAPAIGATGGPEANTPAANSSPPPASLPVATVPAPVAAGSAPASSTAPGQVNATAGPATPSTTERPTPSAPAAGAAEPDPRVYAFLDTLRITGVRASPTDPKVLMNDRVFRLNDLVDRQLGLRLSQVGIDRLTFVDAKGVAYVKNF